LTTLAERNGRWRPLPLSSPSPPMTANATWPLRPAAYADALVSDSVLGAARKAAAAGASVSSDRMSSRDLRCSSIAEIGISERRCSAITESGTSEGCRCSTITESGISAGTPSVPVGENGSYGDVSSLRDPIAYEVATVAKQARSVSDPAADRRVRRRRDDRTAGGEESERERVGLRHAKARGFRSPVPEPRRRE
jgi:hypothetical protein